MADSDPRFHGVWVPALTPFKPDLSVDSDAFVAHCRWLLEQGADGLAVFGTTSEANSLSLDERTGLLEGLVEAGIPAGKLMPGVGCCALPDTVRLCRHALEHGCSAVLMLPPFYYKGVSDDGLFEAFSRVIRQVPSDEMSVFLYHIPAVAQVPISAVLAGRLLEAHPGRVGGLKDSGGDWANTRTMLECFPDLAIFAGSERFLLDTLEHGGAGCITASGNVNPAGIHLVWDQWRRGAAEEARAAQNGITAIRDILERFPMIPALKALCARYYRDEAWSIVRPPLTALSEPERSALYRDVDRSGFSMGDGT